MSPEDRAAVLAQIGVTEDVPMSQVSVDERERIDRVTAPARKKKDKPTSKEVSDTGESASEVLARILKNAGASKEAALAMCDTEAQAFFDARKINKIEAAKRGLDDRSVHNKPLWEQAQTLRNTLKTGVRRHYADATVATKIKATSKKAEITRDESDDAALESFVASGAFAALFAEYKKSLKSGD